MPRHGISKNWSCDQSVLDLLAEPTDLQIPSYGRVVVDYSPHFLVPYSGCVVGQIGLGRGRRIWERWPAWGLGMAPAVQLGVGNPVRVIGPKSLFPWISVHQSNSEACRCLKEVQFSFARRWKQMDFGISLIKVPPWLSGPLTHLCPAISFILWYNEQVTNPAIWWSMNQSNWSNHSMNQSGNQLIVHRGIEITPNKWEQHQQNYFEMCH